MSWRYLFCFFASICLMACGGGGGGGGGGGQLSFNTSPFSLTWEEGAGIPSARVNLNVSGTFGDIYIAGVNPEGHIQDVELYATSDTAGYFEITPSQSLSAGNYTGSITLYVCRDYYCQQQYSGSPATVNYTLKVTPAFKALPSSLNMNALSGQASNATFKVQLPAGVETYTASTSSQLINLSQSGDTVTVNSLPTRSGYYYPTITVKAGARSINVPVNLTVIAPPGGEFDARVNATQLNLSAGAGGMSSSQTIVVTPPTWGGAYTMRTGTSSDTDYSWLQVKETASNVYTIQANASALSKGNYSAYICFVNGYYYSGNPGCTEINLTVGDGLIAPSAQTVLINSETSAAQTSGTVKIDVTPGVSIESWTASSDVSWLHLGKISGLAGESLTYTVDHANLANNSQQTATVTIKTNLSNIVPVTIAITARKALAEIVTINPYTILPNQATRIMVNGQGFKGGSESGLLNFNALLNISGFTPSKIEVISDTQFAMDIPALTSGTYNIGINNALGVETNRKSLFVTAVSIPAGEIISAGSKRSVFFDLARNAIFEVNKTNRTLLRHVHNGQNWNSTSVTIAGLVDAAVSPDGQSIVALQNTGKLLLLNPNTLATEHTYTSTLQQPCIDDNQSWGRGRGLALDTEGKIWFASTYCNAGSPSWDYLAYFDFKTKTFTAMTPPSTMAYIDFAPSSDGSKFYAGHVYGSQILLLNTSSQEKSWVGSTSSFNDMALNADGSRVAFNATSVYDGLWHLVGNLNPGSDRARQAAITSADGSKTYLLHTAVSNFAMTGTLSLSIFNSATTSAADLPLLSTITIDQVSSNCYAPTSCIGTIYKMALTPDGNSLLISSNEKLYIVSLSSQQASGARNQAKPSTGRRMIAVPSRLFKRK